LVTSCAEGDGFIKAPPPKNEFEGWQNLINPVLQKSYEEYQKNKLLKEQFQKDIRRYGTLTKDDLNLAMMIHRFDLKRGDVDQYTYNECTKWMKIYETEIEIARKNYDGPAYVFFFEEFVKLTFIRAGVDKLGTL
jgi:replicative DNA helicase